MQEYGALLRNTFKNPFDDFNASLIDTDKIVRFWCDPIDKGQKELLSAPVFFTQKMPFIIQGSRGSGKTMLFKYYSYDAQKIVAKESGNPDNPNSVYVIFLGFEGALSLKVLEEAVYKHLMFVNSLPSLSQKYKDISILNNRSSIKGKKYDSILYAPADNPFEVYNFLEKNYADEPSICISPLATKPVALGVCLFALNYEKVRIVYPISDIYSSHVTNQVTKTLVYEISLTQ